MDESRIKKAVLKYLALRGYDVLDEDYKGCIVAHDPEEDEIAFISFGIGNEDNDFPVWSRERFEKTMIKWFQEEAPEEIVDIPCRHDAIRLTLCGHDRGLIAHLNNYQFELERRKHG